MNGLAKGRAEGCVREAEEGEVGTEMGEEEWRRRGLWAEGESIRDGEGVMSWRPGEPACCRSGMGERAGGEERCLPGLASTLSELAKPCKESELKPVVVSEYSI
jgi:hypothetical protein